MTHDAFTNDASSDFADAALLGLATPQKTLPCQYFYDRRGSELFEKITDAPEYYPTRTETAILQDCVGEIVAGTPAGSVLIEFGSGSSRKTEIPLDALDKLAAYVPIDVSASALDEARARLASRFPKLRVETVVGDFRSTLVLPDDLRERPRMGFFPGSTIGNFQRPDAVVLLAGMATMMGTGGRLIVGVDLCKTTTALLPAYNDAAGVTAAFNKNLLARANRELGADFDLDGFAHEAIFNDTQSRIEMHLVSRHAQTVSLLGRRFAFRAGETIHTENSHKYTVGDFRDLATRAGWAPVARVDGRERIVQRARTGFEVDGPSNRNRATAELVAARGRRRRKDRYRMPEHRARRPDCSRMTRLQLGLAVSCLLVAPASAAQTLIPSPYPSTVGSGAPLDPEIQGRGGPQEIMRDPYPQVLGDNAQGNPPISRRHRHQHLVPSLHQRKYRVDRH